MAASAHLRGIVIAGALAALALALGFVTLAMNQGSSSAAPHTVLSLKARGLEHGKKPAASDVGTKTRVVHHAAPNPNLVAALKAGLPRSIGEGLAAKRVAVVVLTSSGDPVAGLALHEAQAGAQAAGAAFVRISVDHDGGDASRLTEVLGSLPTAPATLVYVRPATLFVQMPGFNDRTVVEQAAHSAFDTPAATPAAPTATMTTPAAPTTTPTTPATTTPAAA